MPNNHIHSDSKKRHSFVTLLFTAGHVKRYGFLLSMLLTTVLLRLWDVIGLGLNAPLTHAVWAGVAVLGAWACWRLPPLYTE